MLGIGAFTPLDGFMGQADWKGACVDMALPSKNNLIWPIPITLSTTKGKADTIKEGEEKAQSADPYLVQRESSGIQDIPYSYGIGRHILSQS
jgi:ATP sulfurylase